MNYPITNLSENGVYVKFAIGEAQAYLAYLKLYQELFHFFT